MSSQPTPASRVRQRSATAPQPRQTLLPLLYAMDEAHGWSQGMRAITHTLLAHSQLQPGPRLELGCGSGLFLRELQERSPTEPCVGLDRNGMALAFAAQRANTGELTQADLQQLPFRDNHFALLVALDVFDQRQVDLRGALGESWRVLQPGGHLVLRISAHPWLHSAHDRAFNTGRRYHRAEVAATLQAAAFQVERFTYANLLLAPPIILQRLLQRWHWLAYSSNHTVAPRLNQSVAQALQWEARLLRHCNLPFGISLYVIARKPL
ncbi:MAG: class I SAM-dependent methyltransferase [Caldilineaceae bacterium]|nr:class I SAM-dependent methyltransferase [Caldilineaceae bacterium]